MFFKIISPEKSKPVSCSELYDWILRFITEIPYTKDENLKFFQFLSKY